jgi:hypothetical protein
MARLGILPVDPENAGIPGGRIKKGFFSLGQTSSK